MTTPLSSISSTEKSRINITQLGLFLCGQLGLMLLVRYFLQWIIKFSTLEIDGVILFSASTVGLLLLSFRIFDGVTDPIAGILSDLWVQRGHERRTLLWYTAPLPAMGLCLCFLPSAEMSEGIRWILIGVGMLIFFTGYTAYALPYWSLTGDYSTVDKSASGALSNCLGIGLLLATGVGFVISPFIVEWLNYFGGALLFSVLSLPLMIAPYFAAPKSPIPPDIQGDTQEDGSSLATIDSSRISGKDQFYRALKHKKFRAVLCLFAGSQMSFTMMTAAAPFIAEDLLGGSTRDVAALLGPLLLTAALASAVVPKISRSIGWLTTLRWSCILLGGVYVVASGLGSTMIHASLLTAGLIFAAGGPMVAALLGLEGEAVNDCCSESGGESVGVFFGVYNLVVKGFNGLAIFLVSVLAEWATIYPKGSADRLFAVRFMTMGAGILLLFGVISYFLLRPRVTSS